MKGIIKLLLFSLLLWQIFCSYRNLNVTKYRNIRSIYTSNLTRLRIEKEENKKYPPPRGSRNLENYHLSLFFALREKEDSSLKYFYKGIANENLESILLKIYVPRHIKSFSLEEKIFYIKEGRKRAKEKKLYGFVVDSYLLEAFVWKENKDTVIPSLIDSALKYSRSFYDSLLIRDNMLYLIKPIDFPKYFELDKKINEKLKKRKPACGS